MTPLAIGANPWIFHAHPDVVALVVALLAGYTVAVRRWGKLFHPGRREPAATGRQWALFVAGIASLYLALGWPVHDLGEGYLYTFHMLQHLLLGFVTPPLILLGTPEWLGRLLLGRGALGHVYKRLSRPLLAALLFNAALALIHWPRVVDLMLASEAAHAAIHLVFLLAAFLMWSALYSPLPELVTLSPIGRMGFLFAQTILPTVPASFLTFGDRPLYRAYEAFPRLWGLSPLDDMQLAGLIMKIGGGLLLWSIITVMFFRWASREEAAGRLGRSDGLSESGSPSPAPWSS
ncbi:MAG: cytochrome c oxidase assembly protein [Actinomycetota bacterium]|nr:cytochrome c oxidase assembly protein [Actinomycetota bacterium]